MAFTISKSGGRTPAGKKKLAGIDALADGGASTSTKKDPGRFDILPKTPTHKPEAARDARHSPRASTPSSKKPGNGFDDGKRTDPLQMLNNDQYEAATVPLGRSLIIASAGTGKTSTIMGRISCLLKRGVAPGEIVLLTFTSKAAGEMKARLAKYFGSVTAEAITTGSFHSVCLRMVKQIRPNEKLKRPEEMKLLFRAVFEHRKFDTINTEQAPLAASSVYDEYSLFINTTTGGQGFADWLCSKKPDQSDFVEIYEHVCDEFEAMKRREGFYDYNDLLIMVSEYFVHRPSPYREIIVDEFQDTNVLQSSLLDTINPESLYCVGDYDQSIYAFNGAEIGIIGSFSSRYPGANVKTLRKNYRSSRSILALAEKVIGINPRLYPKGLEVMTEDDPHEPRLMRPSDPVVQYQRVTADIAQDQDYGETAVIYRSNSSGDGIEVALKEAGIPCERKGGKSFFESKDMMCFIAIYRLLAGDNSLPVFLQALAIAPISPAAAKLAHAAFRVFGRGSIIKGMTTPDVSRKSKAMPATVENTQMAIVGNRQSPPATRLGSAKIGGDFISHPVLYYEAITPDAARTLYLLFSLARQAGRIGTPVQMVSKISESILMDFMLKRYAAGFSRDSAGKIVEALFQKNLFGLKSKHGVLQRIAEKKASHAMFLADITRNKDDADERSDAVQLLTVHASKGLEFTNVHLMDMTQDTFPNSKLMTNGGGGIEEERRLFYVAVTRAKRKIVLYSPMKDKKGSPVVPSQFLYEGGLLEKEADG